MKYTVGFDAKRAFHNSSGLGVYSRELISSVQRIISEKNIVLFTPQKKIWQSSLKTYTSTLGFIWRSFLIYFDIKKSGISIYHGLAGELPFWMPSDVRKIVTIHDILFERFPNDYPWIDRILYRFKAKHACQHADIIIAISHATKKELVQRYGIDGTKISVIPNGIAPIDRQLHSSDNRLISRDYILCISSFMPRKNQELLVKAYCQIADNVSFDLIFIGTGKHLHHVQKLAKTSPFSERIIFMGQVSDEEKINLLIHAHFSVYPSKYEGFGIPIIEAFALECPILISDNDIHREVGGDAAFYFENENVNDLSAQLLRMNTLTPVERKEAQVNGKLKLSEFDSEIIAKRLVETIYQL